MKTKKILTILTLPALLAACTAENDVLMNNAQELVGRKALDSEMNIGFFGADQVDSRLSMGETSIVLDSNDKIAAALIDRVKTDESEAGVNGYVITEGIATNHPFTTTDNKKWSTPTQLVEGNYLFYYQYNEKLADNRGAAVPFTIAKNQFAYAKDAKDVFVADQAVKDNAMGIGYAYLGADATGYTPKNVNVQMYNLFAFLKFNIKTDKEGLEVQQIKVTPKKAQFKLSGAINNAKVAAKGKLTADRLTASEENPLNAGVLFGLKEDGTYLDGSAPITSSFANFGATQTEYVILSLPDLAVDATAQSAYVVVPAADYKVNGTGENQYELEVMVYTNQGVFTRNVHLEGGEGASAYDYTKLTMGTVQPITLDIKGNLTAAETYFVGSVEEWKKAINSLPASTATNPKTAVTFEMLEDVELTKADIDLIQSTNAKDYALNIAGESIILTESCDLNDITIAEVTVKPGVTVNLNKNTSIATLNNNGTINVNTVSGTGNAVAVVATLNNKGVANIERSASVATLVNGDSAANADNSAVEVNVNAGVYTIGAFTNYKGANATVATGAELKLKGTNAGSIEVNGTLITTGAFANSGSIDAKANSIVTNAAAEIVNSGSIAAAAGADITVGDNADGIITYNDGAIVAVNGTKGKIAYVITEAYEVPTAKVEYNTIVVDGLNIKLTDGQTTENANLVAAGITNIIVKNNSTLDASLVAVELDLIEVEGKNSIITRVDNTTTADVVEGLSTKTLKVAAGAYLTIPLYSTINVTTTTMTATDAGKLGLQNKARINVGGALYYSNNDAWKTTVSGVTTYWVTVGELLGSGKINE